MKNEEHNKKISYEIIRFIITGIICAALDFLTMYVTTILLKKTAMNDTWINVIATLAGFIIGVIANYILSTIWVFKNVEDKNKSKKTSFIVVFVILSALGWGLSFGAWELCFLACQAWFNVNINEVQLKFSIITTSIFWLYATSFVIKTIVGMVWNYLTRKFILYKAPKENKEISEDEQ